MLSNSIRVIYGLYLLHRYTKFITLMSRKSQRVSNHQHRWTIQQESELFATEIIQSYFKEC